MSRYPTIDFIHLCDVPKGKERLKTLAENTGFNVEIIEPYEKDIEKILDFIQKVDKKYHEMAEEKSFFEENSFFAATLHGHIASDLRSIILLSLSRMHECVLERVYWKMFPTRIIYLPISGE